MLHGSAAETALAEAARLAAIRALQRALAAAAYAAATTTGGASAATAVGACALWPTLAPHRFAINVLGGACAAQALETAAAALGLAPTSVHAVLRGDPGVVAVHADATVLAIAAAGVGPSPSPSLAPSAAPVPTPAAANVHPAHNAAVLRVVCDGLLPLIVRIATRAHAATVAETTSRVAEPGVAAAGPLVALPAAAPPPPLATDTPPPIVAAWLRASAARVTPAPGAVSAVAATLPG